MKRKRIAFVIHELALTGAPILGLQLASHLREVFDVKLISKKDGPLLERAKDLGFLDVIVTNTSHELGRIPLSERISKAIDILQSLQADIVFVNSVAAGDWLPASRILGIKAVLFCHEMRHGIQELVKAGVIDADSVSNFDYCFTASRDCMAHFTEMIKKDTCIENFGIAIDIDEVTTLSHATPDDAVNFRGQRLELGKKDFGSRRYLVGMCGKAQYRKGSDLFWELAREIPESDFLWIGPWNDDSNPTINPALALNNISPLSNLYWTNLVANPYPSMKRCDLIVLTSREDPNPLIVAEALIIGTPVLTFVNTGGSHQITSRYGLSLSGAFEVGRVKSILAKYEPDVCKGNLNTTNLSSEMDLKIKVEKLIQRLQSL